MFAGECLKKIYMTNSITFFSTSSSSLMFRATTPIMLGSIRCLCVSLPTKPTISEAKAAAGGEGDKVVLVVKKRRSKSSLLGNNDSGNRSKKETAAELKENWLDSLSSPFLQNLNPCHNYAGGGGSVDDTTNNGSFPSTAWVIGVDPDVSGAIALLKLDNDHTAASSAQVFDSPHVKMLIGKRSRRRLDAKSIVHLLRSFDAPVGTIAYVEQSTPFPQDGKQGWWSGGFGYGLWIGILVASGFSVVPVPSVTWKNKFCLSGSRSSKDDSRELASTLFPTMRSLLKRKKDHGRAEALLIATYGKGLKLSTNLPEDLTSCNGLIGDNLALSAHKLQLN